MKGNKNQKRQKGGIVCFAIAALLFFFPSCQHSPKKETVQPPEVTTPEEAPTLSFIGTLENEEGQVLEGCGCYFSSQENNSPIYAGTNEVLSTAWMNIEGKIEKFTETQQRSERTTDNVTHLYRVFKSPSYVLRMDKQIKGRGEEGVLYEGVLSITRGTVTKEMPFHGYCGC